MVIAIVIILLLLLFIRPIRERLVTGWGNWKWDDITEEEKQELSRIQANDPGVLI